MQENEWEQGVHIFNYFLVEIASMVDDSDGLKIEWEELNSLERL